MPFLPFVAVAGWYDSICFAVKMLHQEVNTWLLLLVCIRGPVLLFSDQWHELNSLLLDVEFAFLSQETYFYVSF